MALDPASGTLVPGRLVSREMFNTHRAHGGALPRELEDEESDGSSSEIAEDMEPLR